jgi:hypothetical protein
VVAGFAGRGGLLGGLLVDQIVLRCAEILVTETGTGASIRLGPVAVLPPAGGAGGSPLPTTDCAPPSVATSSDVRAGDGVDAFGLGCSTPVLTP